LIDCGSLWVPPPIRLSTIVTFLAVFALVAWRFHASRRSAFYNGVVAGLATLGLYEVLFNLTGRFPPFDMLPFWAVGLLVCSMLLGLIQARNHFVWGRLPVILLSAFVIDWLIWIQVGFSSCCGSIQRDNEAALAFRLRWRTEGKRVGFSSRPMSRIVSDMNGEVTLSALRLGEGAY